MQKHLFLFIITFFIHTVQADISILDEYIQFGLENNLALQQKKFSLKQSIHALKEARGMFLPSISIDARYSRAGGGRIIDFPAGDIVNPMHQALNYLLGQPNLFPANLENVQTPFLREEEQETKIRLIQPIFQPNIYYNYKIQAKLKDIQQTEKKLFSRELVKNIKIAYYSYLKTTKIVHLFKETKKLVEENLEVSKKLLQADKSTHEVVYRAEAELSLIDQQKFSAENQQVLARSYFNFLLNKQLNDDIIIDDSLSIFRAEPFYYDQLLIAALENREEIQQLKVSINIMEDKKNNAKSNFLPKVNGVVDYGFQGEEYRFTDADDFWMASLVLQWNLFNGFQDKAKYQQSVMERQKLKIQYEELEKQIELQVRQAYDNLQIAAKTIYAANQQLRSVKASFEILKKKYAQGMSSQIEFLDARNTLTDAEINVILKIYDYYTLGAEMERISATYPLLD
jgi:outer membrane protein